MSRYLFRLQALLAFGCVVAVLVLTGLGFLIAALYMNLAQDMGSIAAALIIGLACLAAALIVLLIALLVLRPAARRNSPGEKIPDAMQLALAVGEAFGGDLKSMAKSHRSTIIGIALAAGFAFGVSPRLRRSLKDLLDK
jgi:predicted RND superfamily exporter protein